MSTRKSKVKNRKRSDVPKASSSPGFLTLSGATKYERLLPALPIILALAVYFNALNNPFVYDDYASVVENPSLADLSNLKRIFLHMRFRPLANLSYALDYTFWQLNPLGYHITNLILHLINILLFFYLTRHFLNDRLGRHDAGEVSLPPRVQLWAPLALASLFAVHPLMTQAVGYVGARPDLLCTTFFLAAFLVLRRWLTEGGRLRVSLGLVFFVLALASKEIAAALPLILLLYHWLLLPRSDAPPSRRSWLHPVLITTIFIGGAIRLHSLLAAETEKLVRPIWLNFLTELGIVWRYLLLWLFPVSQSIVHPAQTVRGLMEGQVLLAGSGLILLVVIAFSIRHSRPLSSLGLAWFLLVLAPSSSLIPLNELMAEHRAYLPSLGLYWIALDAGLLLLAAKSPSTKLRRLVAATLVVLIGSLGLMTVARNRVWSTPVTLWRDAAQKAPKTWASFYFLGQALRRENRYEEAIDAYRRAVLLSPDEPETYLKLGSCFAHLGNYSAAAASFSAARELDDDSPQAYNELGKLAATQGRFQEAQKHLDEALKRDSRSPDALFNLALLHERIYNDPATALRLCVEVRGLVADQNQPVEDCIRRNRAKLDEASAP